MPNGLFVYAALLGLLAAVPPARAGNVNVVAWGAGMVNNRGDGYDYGQSIVPATLTNAVQVAGGWPFSLALKANGTLLGWGDDHSSNETNFPATGNYIAIACSYLHDLALESNGLVAAAGDDTYGQTAVPSNLSNVVAVACGWFHCLALKSDGTVVAWGTSTNPLGWETDQVSYGQRNVPAGLSNVVAIAGGGWHSLALKADGTLAAWGRNDYSEATIPPGVSNVVAIAADAAGNLVLEGSGKLVAWGDNEYGQTNVPSNLTNGVVAIAAGGWHYLALKTNGTVVAWGAGVGSNQNVDYGQSTVPAGLTNVIQIAAGLVHSLALVGSGPPVLKTPLTVVRPFTNGFAAKLPTRNGRVYRLEYQNALTNQTWSAFPLQAGTGGTNEFIDATHSSAQRFYRASRW